MTETIVLVFVLSVAILIFDTLISNEIKDTHPILTMFLTLLSFLSVITLAISGILLLLRSIIK